MVIRYTEGNVREMRRLTWIGVAVAGLFGGGFAFLHASVSKVWVPTTEGTGMIALLAIAATEIRVRRRLARAGKPALDFSDRTFLYWRKINGPPEEISYAEILTYYVTLLASSESEPEAFVSIEFRKRRRIRLRSSRLDISPQQLIALIKLKLNAALPQKNT